MPRHRTRAPGPDPFTELGLQAGADEAAIVEARRRLAKRAHPDAGGSVEAMQRLNQVAQAALDQVRRSAAGVPTRTGQSTPRPAHRHSRERPAPPNSRRDHPSFTIEALPVEAFEALSIVAAWLGTVIDDDPPYLIEVALVEPVRGWCRLDVVPDAGASTVSIAVASEPGHPPPDVDAVRDTWVAALNRLDWNDLDGG